MRQSFAPRFPLLALVAAVMMLTAEQARGVTMGATEAEFLTEARCIGCHGHPARMALRGKTRLGWLITTHRMAEVNDAPVSWHERLVIADHLHALRPASPVIQIFEYGSAPAAFAVWMVLRWRARRLLTRSDPPC